MLEYDPFVKEGFLVRDKECFKDGVGVNAEEQLLQNQRKLCLVNQLSTAPGTLQTSYLFFFSTNVLFGLNFSQISQNFST